MTKAQPNNFSEIFKDTLALTMTGVPEIDALGGLVSRLQVCQVDSFADGAKLTNAATWNMFPNNIPSSIQIVEEKESEAPYPMVRGSHLGLRWHGDTEWHRAPSPVIRSYEFPWLDEWSESDLKRPGRIVNSIIVLCEDWLLDQRSNGKTIVTVNCVDFYANAENQEQKCRAIKKAIRKLNTYAADKHVPIIVCTNIDLGDDMRSSVTRQES